MFPVIHHMRVMAARLADDTRSSAGPGDHGCKRCPQENVFHGGMPHWRKIGNYYRIINWSKLT
jgi:hypothetical protein